MLRMVAMTTILTASGPADLLGLIPTLAGFTPRRSLVLLPFIGTRAGGAMRADLPKDAGVDLHEYAATLVGMACRVPAVDGLAAVVYGDDPLDADALPFAEVADIIVACAESCDLRLVEMLCVGPDGWADYLAEVPLVRDLAEIPDAPQLPGVVGVAADQSAGGELPQVDLIEKERVGQALAAVDQMMTKALPGDDPERTTENREAEDAPEDREGAAERLDPRAYLSALALDDLPLFLENLLETPENLDPFATAALIWCLDRPMLRDVALAQWATDLPTGDEVLDAQLAFRGDVSRFPAHFGEILLGQGPRPDGDRLRLALTLTRNAAARAPRASRVGALVASAWLSWALGSSTHADHYLTLAHEITPDHTFTNLMRTIVDAGMLPAWAFTAAGMAAPAASGPAA